MENWLALGLFNLFVLGMLALDLGVFHRRAHVVSFREAAAWTAVWVGLAIVFNLGVYYWRGPQAALEFLAGYILEESLSMDNVFVFALIFAYAAVPNEYQHRVLFWGILGALVMRAAFIAAGVALISHFAWVLYIFGAFLLITGAKIFRERRQEIHPERNPALRLARRLFPLTERYEGARFFVRREGRLLATPLFPVLVLIETSDLAFAVDSIPAVFAVTQDLFIVYTSNVFAILGLRSLYFFLAGAIAKFRYLRPGLALVLVFVGAKMLAAHFYKLPVGVSLLVICGILGGSVVLSLRGETKSSEPVPAEGGASDPKNPVI